VAAAGWSRLERTMGEMMKKHDLYELQMQLEADRRRVDPCPWMGYAVMALIFVIFMLSVATLYAADRMCYGCGAWYDAKEHYDCPACNPPIDMEG